MSKEKLLDFFAKNKMVIILASCLIIGLLLIFWPTSNEAPQSENDYAFRLEERLVSIVSAIDGVSDVKIILTLESAGESVYASSNLVDTKTPQIRGVAVVCKNGDNNAVRLKIIKCISAVTGLGSNKISVCE